MNQAIELAREAVSNHFGAPCIKGDLLLTQLETSFVILKSSCPSYVDKYVCFVQEPAVLHHHSDFKC